MKRIIFVILVLFLLLIIANLVGSILSLWSKKDLLTQAKQQLAQDERQNTSLRMQLKHVSSPSFLEEQARDKLFLGKPGEVLVVFPSSTPSAEVKQTFDSVSKPIWQQWWEVFF